MECNSIDIQKEDFSKEKCKGRKHHVRKHHVRTEKIESDYSFRTSKKEDFPVEIKKLYLDGNNMLFIFSTLRNLILKKRNRKEADKLICKIWLDFGKIMKFKKTILMFDDTKLIPSSLEKFELICARPKFKTSDEYFVDIAQKLKNPQNSLFVTSDAELRQNLKKCGVKICGTKGILTYAISIINGSLPVDINDWLMGFRKEMVEFTSSSSEEVEKVQEEKNEEKVERKENKERKKFISQDEKIKIKVERLVIKFSKEKIVKIINDMN